MTKTPQDHLADLLLSILLLLFLLFVLPLVTRDPDRYTSLFTGVAAAGLSFWGVVSYGRYRLLRRKESRADQAEPL